MVKIVLTIIISYLIGSISPSILIGRARGIDIKKEGSGNAGTTNALRVLGAKAAVITLVVDILKGLLPAILFPLIFGMPELCYWSSLAAFIGHLFPVYYGFKGG
ncbi:MAG: glycerol-3-phosphate acyltransferase, partial [Firmicutes bacterium]|nr:glycerol-3-phosphate acyltransferase [Bacillota bacterium]